MIPELRLRIDTTLRALTDSVIPAIKPEAKQAIEHAYLAVSHLRMIGEQFDKVYEFQLAELAEFSELVDGLLSCMRHKLGKPIPGDEQAVELVAKAEAIVALPIPAQQTVADLIYSLKTFADVALAIALDSDDASIQQVTSKLVLQRAGRQIERERVWARKAGFDLDADRLPSLESVLSRRSG